MAKSVQPFVYDVSDRLAKEITLTDRIRELEKTLKDLFKARRNSGFGSRALRASSPFAPRIKAVTAELRTLKLAQARAKAA